MSDVPAAQRELVDRARERLPKENIREVRMFGAVAVMVDGSMAVAAQRDGSLLVHVDPGEDPALLEHPHAFRPEMGAGRSMGRGWIGVGPDGVRADADLDAWVAAAVRGLAARG